MYCIVKVSDERSVMTVRVVLSMAVGAAVSWWDSGHQKENTKSVSYKEHPVPPGCHLWTNGARFSLHK